MTADADRARYHARAARGECTRCGRPAEPGRTKCAACAAAHRAYQAARVARGACELCGRPAERDDDGAPRRRCARCAYRQRYRALRDQRRCVRCGAPAALDHRGRPMSRCAVHLDEAAAHDRARRRKP